MTMLFRTLATAAALVAAAPAAAQDATALNWLVGEWRGTGTMFGNPSEATLSVRPVLGGRFLELNYRAGGFEGRALYQFVDGGSWRAHWFDNRGTTFAIRGYQIEQSLRAEWGSPETEQGMTTYVIDVRGRLRVTDAVRRDGTYRDFATHVFERAE
ncbi:MAG TPA: hypothetical protein VMG08_05160 [Allosphingosinicella sp.]|nr:hypothetical protein [Allosphingosinicella sp.]